MATQAVARQPITACAHPDQQAPPRNPIVFYYIWNSKFKPVQGRSSVGLFLSVIVIQIPLPVLFPLRVGSLSCQRNPLYEL